jgi:hypothetical protein
VGRDDDLSAEARSLRRRGIHVCHGHVGGPMRRDALPDLLARQLIERGERPVGLLERAETALADAALPYRPAEQIAIE